MFLKQSKEARHFCLVDGDPRLVRSVMFDAAFLASTSAAPVPPETLTGASQPERQPNVSQRYHRAVLCAVILLNLPHNGKTVVIGPDPSQAEHCTREGKPASGPAIYQSCHG
ncbi:unnamed protein product [Boreogadus saida]